MGVAQHHVRRVGRLRRMGRHGMAIDQQAEAEPRPRLGDQAGECGVIRLPARADARLGLGEGKPAAIHRLPARDDARDGAEAGADTRT